MSSESSSSSSYITTLGVGVLGMCVGASVAYYTMESKLKETEKTAEQRRRNDIRTMETTLAKQRDVIKKLRGSLSLAMQRPMASSPMASPEKRSDKTRPRDSRTQERYSSNNGQTPVSTRSDPKATRKLGVGLATTEVFSPIASPERSGRTRQ